jgi:NAD(P)-dependent dehydrogenase (short-subunit alcohol dehydrogenase family)
MVARHEVGGQTLPSAPVARWDRGIPRATALGRLGTPEEVAGAVEYLLTAEFATGSVLVCK